MNRITKEDREYCALQQRAYDKSRTVLLKLLKESEKAEAEQSRLLGEEADAYFKGFGNSVSGELRNALTRGQTNLIGRLVYYFSQKYFVSLDNTPIEATLLPQRPKYFKSKAECEAYRQAVCSLRLDYTGIVEQILAQLGGMTFQEKAIADLKARCRAAAWGKEHTGRFERKKKVISFPVYAVYWKDWPGDDFIGIDSGVRDVISALPYFEKGKMARLEGDLARLLDYKYDQPALDTGMKKANRLRFYKNGRLDICFSKEEYARKFAEEFLEDAA